MAGRCTPPSDLSVRVLFTVGIDRILDVDAGSRTGALPDAVEGRLRGLFGSTGFFSVLPAASNPPNAAEEGLTDADIDLQAWHDAGAYAVVKGRVWRHRKDRLRLELRLFVTEEGGSRVLPEEVMNLPLGRQDLLKRAVARWVDDVVAEFTGKGGSLSARVAFARRQRAGGAKEIFVMDVDGENLREVTRNGSINLLPAWTRDGRVAFTSYYQNNPNTYIEGGLRLSSYPSMNTGVAFHPDGRSAAITLSKDGNAEIYVISAKDGRVLRRLTRNTHIDTSPTWSPDGARLAWVSDASGNPQIWIMNADGGAPQRMRQVGGYNTGPDWSPGGDDVAYTVRGAGEKYDVFVTRLSTGAVRRLTSAGSNQDPSFSPDGRYIAYTSTAGGGPRQIWIMSSDGRFKQQVTHVAAIHYDPAWER